MTESIVFYSDASQLNIWSAIKQQLYAPFDRIVRENIGLNDENLIALGPIRQLTKILPASILNKKYKTILGSQSEIDLEILKNEINENAALGFHTSSKTLGIHSDLITGSNRDFFEPYITTYNTSNNKRNTLTTIDATISSKGSGEYISSPIKRINKPNYKAILVLPFVTMVAKDGWAPTLFESSMAQDHVIDMIQKKGYVDFNTLTARPSFGWFDCVRARYLIQKYQCDGVILTFPDFLPYDSDIKLCTSYIHNNELYQDLNENINLKEMTPFYETYMSWEEDLSKYSQLYDFPAAFFKVTKRIEQMINCPILSIMTANSKSPKIDITFPHLF